jgi:hypothetical protein
MSSFAAGWYRSQSKSLKSDCFILYYHVVCDQVSVELDMFLEVSEDYLEYFHMTFPRGTAVRCQGVELYPARQFSPVRLPTVEIPSATVSIPSRFHERRSCRRSLDGFLREL